MLTSRHIPNHIKRHAERTSSDAADAIEPSGSMLSNIKQTYAQQERERIEQVLRGAGYHITKAAQQLGMSRQSLQYWMKKYGLEKK